MRTDRVQIPRKGEVAALVVFGLLVIAVALPLAVRDLMLLPHRATVDGLSDGRALPVDDVSALNDTLRLVQVFPGSERIDRVAAQVAKRRFEGPERIEALRRAARRAPGDSLTWMTLAVALPPGPDAARALRLSALTNAFDYDATPRRVDLGLRLWPYMDAADKQAFGRLVLALWDWEPGRLAMVAARRDGYDQIVPYLQASRETWTSFPGRFAVHRLSPEEPYLHGPP